MLTELAETHSAVVLLMGDRAYKIKKHVDLGFLDFRDEQVRRDVCRREVELNRRVAPDVYLDTLRIVGADGRTYEDGVVMRRMPDDLRLSTMIARGLDVEPHLHAIAELMARFHATADRSPQIAAEGTRSGLRRRWVDNLSETEKYRGQLLGECIHARISALALAYVDGREALLAERAEQGLVVDGHGDLLAEDVFCLPDYPRVLDCIEFDDKLRWLDVLDDVAFLAMDLEYLDRADLAEYFLASYLQLSATPQVATLRHHYIAYRAFVRAKIMCIQAAQGRSAAVVEADRYARLALRHLEAGEVLLILVGGAPGTGKTTVARELALRLGAAVLSSDDVRRNVPVSPGERYSALGKQATYHAMLNEADTLLRHGQTVVLDATWGDQDMRALAAQTGEATMSRVVGLECTVEVDVAAARAERRLADGTGSSEAGAAIARSLAATRAPWPDATVIDTSGNVVESVARAIDAVDASGY